MQANVLKPENAYHKRMAACSKMKGNEAMGQCYWRYSPTLSNASLPSAQTIKMCHRCMQIELQMSYDELYAHIVDDDQLVTAFRLYCELDAIGTVEGQHPNTTSLLATYLRNKIGFPGALTSSPPFQT